MSSSLLHRRSVRRASSSVTPWIRSSLRRPPAPATRRTSRRATPSRSATKRVRAALALPSWAGAASRRRKRQSATPATSSRGAPGVTQTARLTPPTAARSGPDSPLEVVLVHPAVDVGEEIVVLTERDPVLTRRALRDTRTGLRGGHGSRRRGRHGSQAIGVGRRLHLRRRRLGVIRHRRLDDHGRSIDARRYRRLAGDGLFDRPRVSRKIRTSCVLHGGRRRRDRVVELSRVALEHLTELDAAVLFRHLDLGHGLLDGLLLRVRLVDHLARLQLGLVQDELSLLGSVLLELFGAALGGDQRLLQGLLEAPIAGDLLLERFHALLAVDVLLEQVLVLVGDLVEVDEFLDVGVAPHAALELLVADVQRCELHAIPPRPRGPRRVSTSCLSRPF